MSGAPVLIAGGGISGLATGWWLARGGTEVEIWEADPRPGGKILSRREQGYLTERAAGILVNFRPEVDQALRRTGLWERRRSQGTGVRRYLLRGGRLDPVPMEIGALLRSPLWSSRAKVRMTMEALVPRGGHDRESVSEFIERRLGRELLDTAIDPFVSGTLASDPDLANARATLPRLTALEQRYGSITLGMLAHRVLGRRRANVAEPFTFPEGLSELVQALTEQPGLHLRCGLRVTEIRRAQGVWCVTGRSPAGLYQREVPALVLSTPADVAGALLAEVDGELSALLRSIEYAPLAVLHLGLDRRRIDHPLDGTGFLVPSRGGPCFNGNLWMSSLFPGRAPEGHALITTYVGGCRNPGLPSLGEEELADRVLRDLAPVLGIRGRPDYLRLDRHPRGLPLYHGAYPERVRGIRRRLAGLPGLHLNANYLDGVSVRERIFQAGRTAAEIAASPALHSLLREPVPEYPG